MRIALFALALLAACAGRRRRPVAQEVDLGADSGRWSLPVPIYRDLGVGIYLVIGGNTFTTGDVSPLHFIQALRLPNGRPPRMDMYGHNPFTSRKPKLSKPPLGYGFADFSDLDTLAGWVDHYLGRPRHRRLRFFLSEFFLPTDHPNHEFNFWVTRRAQADFLAAALRITRRWDRIYTLGWLGLYDDPPRSDGMEVDRGLIDRSGHRKAAYYTYRRG